MLELLSNLLQELAGNVVFRGLRIDKQHAQLAGAETQEVDDAHAALLAHAGARPPDFATAATAGNDSTSFWLPRYPREELQSLLGRPDLSSLRNEGGRLVDAEHTAVYGKDVLPARRSVVVGSNVRHERRAKGREAACGTSARWRG